MGRAQEQQESSEQRPELQRLAELPEEGIDTSDMPEAGDFSDAVRGRFYRPIKRQITLRIDADLLEWFRAQGGKYQTLINAALREYVEGHRGRARKKKAPVGLHRAKAIKSTAHQLARLVYALLTKGQSYVEKGIEAHEARSRERQLRALERKARQFGLCLQEAA